MNRVWVNRKELGLVRMNGVKFDDGRWKGHRANILQTKDMVYIVLFRAGNIGRSKECYRIPLEALNVVED